MAILSANQLLFLYEKVKNKYSEILEKEHQYTVEWAHYKVLDKKGNTVIDKETGIEISGRMKLFPKPELESDAKLGLKTIVRSRFSLSAIISKQEPVKAYFKANGKLVEVDYLNPYLDFYQNTEKPEHTSQIAVKDFPLNAYAIFCGYDSFSDLDQEFQKKQQYAEYQAFFFSHVRYDVWEKGWMRFNHTTKTVELDGFYQQDYDGYFSGQYQQSGANVFISLVNKDGSNYFMMIAKAPAAQGQDFGDIFKASMVTVSSYADQYLASTEVILVRKSKVTEELLLKIKRYFFLRRTRFIVTPASSGKAFQVPPSNEDADCLALLSGHYAGFFRLNEQQIAVFPFVMDARYRTQLEVLYHEKEKPLYQLLYIDISQLGLTHYINFHGYTAEKGPNGSIAQKPEIGQECTLISIKYANSNQVLHGQMHILTAHTPFVGELYMLRLSDADILQWAPFIVKEGEKTHLPVMTMGAHVLQHIKLPEWLIRCL